MMLTLFALKYVRVSNRVRFCVLGIFLPSTHVTACPLCHLCVPRPRAVPPGGSDF